MKRGIILLLAGAITLAGCEQAGVAPEPTATPTVEPVAARSVVAAEATFQPARWSELVFQKPGTVAEVLVSPGEEVEMGSILVRLDSTRAELAVREAEYALDAARADLALLELGPHPAELAAARANVEDAEAALTAAAARREEVAGGATDADIATAEAAVSAAEADWLIARDDRDELYRRTDEDEEKDQEERVQADYVLHAASEALRAAQTRLDTERATAGERLREAQAGVSVAAARRDVVSATLNLLLVGSPDWKIAAAEAEVSQAEAVVRETKESLDQLSLRAPFAGTVTEVAIEPGALVEPGQKAATLATTRELEAHTVDLTELDVARIRPGQRAEVTADARPDSKLVGRVARIGLRSVDYLGDVTYPVAVELEEAAAGLRWGMTALVEIDVE